MKVNKMEKLNTKQLRLSVSDYAKPSDGLAYSIFFIDILLYLALLAGVVFLESMSLKIGCSILAGLKIASLFVIGHDAAHGAYTSSKRANQLIARVAFLPSLHNYTLWLEEHNRNHHQSNNVKGINSWSPMSRAEFDALPVWRQQLEKLYRSPAGIMFYYMIERWWKHKFYPFTGNDKRDNKAMADFAFLVSCLGGYIALLTLTGNLLAHTSALELVLLACVLPFAIWNFMMGFTVYQHHTHETIPWSDSIDERNDIGSQEDFTMHVQYPRWFNMVSHNIMEHTAHHVDPRIPLYHLNKAQERLTLQLGDEMNVVKFSLRDFLVTMSRCKLYDYDNHRWQDFNGIPTSPYLVEKTDAVQLAEAA